jgi:hypothetical protein
MGDFYGNMHEYAGTLHVKSAFFLIAIYYISDFSNGFELKKEPNFCFEVGLPFSISVLSVDLLK